MRRKELPHKVARVKDHGSGMRRGRSKVKGMNFKKNLSREGIVQRSCRGRVREMLKLLRRKKRRREGYLRSVKGYGKIM